MTKISALTSVGDGLAVGDQFIIRDIDDAGTPNKSVTISGITRALQDGTVAAPALAFANDKNTGIYRPGDDQLAISTNGTGRLFIDANGNAGLGTSNPANFAGFVTLALANSSGAEVDFIKGSTVQSSLYNASDIFYIESKSTIPTVFVTNGTERLRITSTGDLNFKGAGTAGSTQAVSFNGSAPVNSMVLTSGGLLGIGTSSPSANLDARGTVALSQMLNVDGTAGTPITAGWAATSAGGKLMTLSNTAAGGSIGNGNTLYLANYSNDNGTYARAFNVTTSGDDKFWVSSNGAGYFAGSVGIGTTSPSRQLDVNSTAIFDSNGNGTTTSPSIAIGSSGVGFSYIGSQQLAFLTNSNERARIDSSGRLLVGTSTPLPGVTTSLIHASTSVADYVIASRNTNAAPYGQFILYGSSPNNTDSQFFVCADSTATRFTVRSNGGITNFQANDVNLSDINSKKDISPATGTWDCIKEWEIVNYHYKDQPDDADFNLGVIAQQIVEICPEVVAIFEPAKDATLSVLDEEGNEVDPAQEAQPEKLGVKEQQMYWMAIKALQEAQVRIEQLESKVAALEGA